VRRYGLDVVVVPEQIVQAEAFGGVPGRRVLWKGREHVLYSLNPC
jgi:hypothetical protein